MHPAEISKQTAAERMLTKAKGEILTTTPTTHTIMYTLPDFVHDALSN